MSSTNPPEQPAASIRQRIQRRLIPLILLAGVVIAGWSSFIVYYEMDEAIINNLSNLNQATARVYGTRVDMTALPDYADIKDLAQKEFLLLVLEADGTVLHSSHPELSLPQIPMDGPLHWNGWSLFQSHTDAGHVVISGMVEEERNELIFETVASTVVPALAVLGALLFAALWFVQTGLRPLQDLSGALRNRDPQALTPLEETGRAAELVPIVRALNGLFARVRAFLQRERKFIDDAAHELRTPLTIIKAQVQAIDPTDLSKENRARLAHILQGVNRAEALGAGLLQQARAEQSADTAQTVDALMILRQLLDDLALTHPESVSRTELVAQDAPLIWAAPEDLRTILRNLLDNALRHGHQDGTPTRLRIEMTLTDGAAVIAIEDAGPGIPETMYQQVFDRFWRAGKAEGTGLGLSIARSLATRGGMSLEVTRGPHLGGARFELRTPLAGHK